MATIYNRRDVGYTIISRFEETYRSFLIDCLCKKYPNYQDGIPQGILIRVNGKSEIMFWEDPLEFFQSSDFPDLLEISIYQENFDVFFKSKIQKDELTKIMVSLYGLRCKIAHIKGFFTSFDLDKLIEQTKLITEIVELNSSFLDLLDIIQKTPEVVVIKVPLDFNIDYLESNGIINNLPTPDYEYEGGFVGREEDIKEIIKYLQREKFPVVTITGAGGVGKTSLALKVIQEITQKPKSEKFDAIIWLSAKENKLSPFGIEDIEPTLKSYDELLDTIINVLGFGIELNENYDSVEKKEDTVNMLFELSNSILIIIDNLETVTDERIINFIIDAPQKTKFLVTSRKGMGQVERRYELKQLKEKEAIYLFRQLAKDKQLISLLKLDNEIIKKYVNKVSNYPLAIKWVIGQVARGRDINTVISSIDDATGDISQFCFEQIFSMLNDKSKLILFALCCFDEPPPASVLRYVVEIESKVFDDCIEELILVSLVIPEQFKNEQNEISRRFTILHLTRGYVRQQLNQNIILRDKITKRLLDVESTVTATEQAKREYRFSLHNLGAVTDEEKIAAIFTQTAFQKYQAGLYDEAVENYKKALNIAPRFSSIYRNWSVMESYENHLYEADQLMSKAAELNPNDSQIWLLWGNNKRKSNKIFDADEMYKKAYNLTPDNHIILNAYGQTRSRLGDYETGITLLNRALKTDLSISSKKHEIINHTSIAETLIGWSEFLYRDRDTINAEKKLLEALEHCYFALKIDKNDPKSSGILCKTFYKLGKHYVKVENFSKAINTFQNALNIVGFGFKLCRYRIKSSIEISKLFIEQGEYEKVKTILEPLVTINDNIYRKYPEILSEIHQVLDNIGNNSSFVNGIIVTVNTISEYVLINTGIENDKNFIANKLDFKPILNSLNTELKDRKVRFIPKIYLNGNKEKREAKNIILLD